MKYTMVALMLGVMVTGCTSMKTQSNGSSQSSNTDGTGVSSGEMGTLPTDGRRDLFPPVFFAYDSAQVNPNESGKIEAVADYLNKGKGKGVIVEGHADERGSREYNLALGEVRSIGVRDYLVTLGVDTTMIHTKSYGEEQPAEDGHDEKALNQNRRVVFAIY
jgi:peptidoglycan-associated lipoprotein